MLSDELVAKKSTATMISPPFTRKVRILSVSRAGIRTKSFMPNNPALPDQDKEGSRRQCSIEILSGEDRIRTSMGDHESVDSAHTPKTPEEWGRSPEFGPVPEGIRTQGARYISVFACNRQETASALKCAHELVSGELLADPVRTTRRPTTSDPLEIRTDVALINASEGHAQKQQEAIPRRPCASTSRPLMRRARGQQWARRSCRASQFLFGAALQILVFCETV